MHRYLYLFLAIGIIISQPYGGGERPKIAILTGRVFNNLTSEPVPYASVSVYNDDDSNPVAGGITDDDGYFFIDKFAPGRYSVNVEFMGYETYVVDGVALNRKEGVRKDLGDIMLVQKVIDVEGVVVVEERETIEFKTDKLVYNVDENSIANSGTAEDALRNVPMVTVNQDGQVSLRGNPGVKILVDGRQNRMGDGPGDVSNIPASLIDQVEVIVSPSAKYDPEGIAGIINIKLKKGEYDGLNGSIKLNGKQTENHTARDMNGVNLYGNYRKGKINIYSSIGYNNRMRWRESWRNISTELSDLDPMYEGNALPADSTELIDFTSDKEIDRSGIKFMLGGDYYLNDYTSLNSEVSFRSGSSYKEGSQVHTSPDSLYLITIDKDKEPNYDISSSFELVRKFRDPGKELLFSVAYDNGFDSEYKILDSDGIESISDTTAITDDNFESEIDLSYTHPLGKDSKLEVGYDGRLKGHDDDMVFTIGDFLGKSKFDYIRSIHALYFDLDYKFSELFSIKPSARIELVSRDMSFSSEFSAALGGQQANSGNFIFTDLLDAIPDSSVVVNEVALYPDLHFAFNLAEGRGLQFGISKRVERPGSGWGSSIRPFPRDVYSPSFIFTGYPFLRPQYSTNYDATFTSKIPMGYLSLNLYYKDITDKMVWYDDDRFQGDVISYRNAGSAYDTGFEVFSIVMGQVLGGSYNRSTLTDNSGDVELSNYNEFMNLYYRITLPEKYIKLFGFEFGGYWMKIKEEGGTLFGANGTLWANIGLSKSILNDNATVSLSLDNIFNEGGFSISQSKALNSWDVPEGYLSAIETTNGDSHRGGRTLKINFKYTFGKLQDEKKRFGGEGRGGGGMDMGL